MFPNIDIALPNLTTPDAHNIRKNGVQLIELPEHILIYNDPFASTPVFFTKTQSGKLFLFSDFSKCKQRNDLELKVDPVGFWEILLFGTPVWNRTLFKGVFQLPAACKLKIDKRHLTFSFQRYWDFNVTANENLSEQQAIEGLNEHLERIFGTLPSNKTYVMGLSAGLDSRLSAAYLSEYVNKNAIKTFTFGHSDKLLEYKQAAKVASAFTIKRPYFHQLRSSSYTDAVEEFSTYTAAQIGMLHSHVCDYLKNHSFCENSVNIANYYTDALFGYATSKEKSMTPVSQDEFFRVAHESTLIDEDTRDAILSDIQCVFEDFSSEANFCSSFEYRYLSERNPKFHSMMAFTQNHYLTTIMPYADIELVKFAISIPTKYKYKKRILDLLQQKYFGNQLSNIAPVTSRGFLSFGNTSRLNSLKTKLDRKAFHIINWSNAFLRCSTNGRIQLLNRYQTEEQERLLRRSFRTLLANSLDFLLEAKLITPSTYKHFKRIPIRGGAGQRCSLIDITATLKHFI